MKECETMRYASASVLKGRIKYRNKIPGEGTAIRQIYDVFMNNKGCSVELPPVACANNRIRDLVDYYGLDIRITRRGDCRTGRASLYILAGEWCGKEYIDYIKPKEK